MYRAYRRFKMSRDAARRYAEAGVSAIDDLIDYLGMGEKVSFIADGLRKVREDAERVLRTGRALAGAAVIAPVGLWQFAKGLGFPDRDISTLGIGRHRFFLFHSSLGVVALRYLHRLWLEREAHGGQPGPVGRAFMKLTGAALGAYAMGVGVHLAMDVFQPKSVVFPFFGSLVDGTLVDDNIWLLGNSLWAFKIARDVFVISFAPELEAAREYVKTTFGDWGDVAYDDVHGRA
jgi:hypothetical protein